MTASVSNWLQVWQHSAWVAAAGFALLQMIWQAALAAGALASALALLRLASARARYAWSCGALFLLPVWFALTLGWGQWGRAAGLPWLPIGASRWLNAVGALLPWLVALWAGGVAVLAMKGLGGWWLLARLRLRATEALPEEWRERFQRLRGVIGRGRALASARLRITLELAAPCVAGWWRPCVLLPAAMLTALPPEQVEAVLAHELAHVRRADYLVNLLQRGVEILFFFHPAVWWISRQVSEEREHCCDDAAIAACGDPCGYARALLTLAESGSGAALAVANVMPALGAGGGSLPRRVRRILGQNTAGHGGAWRALMAALLLAFAVWSFGGRLPSQRTATDPPALPVSKVITPAAPRFSHVALRIRPEAHRPARLSALLRAGQSLALRPQPAVASRPLNDPGASPNAAAPRTIVIAVSLAATSTCSPRIVVVRHVAPTGVTWFELMPVMQCRRQLQPISVWTLTT